MVHYAIESTLVYRGFLSLVADGHAASFKETGGNGEEAIERLVECFQAEMWGGRISAEELLPTYEHACGARDFPAAPVSAADVESIRARLDDLMEKWAAVPLNALLTLEL